MHMYESYGQAIQHGCVMVFLSENKTLTPVTPNDLILTFEPITKVEGLKLIHIFESYGHAM